MEEAWELALKFAGKILSEMMNDYGFVKYRKGKKFPDDLNFLKSHFTLEHLWKTIFSASVSVSAVQTCKQMQMQLDC